MDLDDFKTTWQTNTFITEEKDMNAIHNIVQQQTDTLTSRITRRYGHIVTSSIIGAVAFVILFYTISDGFRESPAGVLMGILFMLTVTALAWRRYQQAAVQDYGTSLKQQLEMRIGQTRRNLWEEQLFVVGLPVTFLILSRLINGRNLTGLLEAGNLLGLGVMAAFTIGLLVIVRYRYRKDMAELQTLLNQLTHE